MYMSNICKTVTLRTRKIKGGEQLSFYLDYYPGYRDESTMKVMRHESLGIYIYAKPKSQREKDYNDRMREKAEALRCRRYESIVNERYDFFDKEKMKGSFLDYFKDKAYKKNTKWENVYLHFTSSNTQSTPCTSIASQAIGQPSAPYSTPPTASIRFRRIPTASWSALTPSPRRKSTYQGKNSSIWPTHPVLRLC